MEDKVRMLFYDFILGVGVQFTITLLFLLPILTPGGIPFYGDETWYLDPSSAYWYSKSIPYLWVEGIGPIVTTENMRFLLIAPLTYLMGLEGSVKLYIVITASLAGILTYFALKILAEEWEIVSKSYIRLMAFFGSLIPLLTFTNIGLVGAATAPAWSYSTLPFSFALFVRFLRKGKTIDILGFGISSIAGSTQPFWLYLMIIIGFAYIFIELVSKSIRKVLLTQRLVIIVIVTLGINAFWLTPITIGYFLGGSGMFQTYVTEKLIHFENLLFLSHWNLLDVTMLGERQYFFFWLHPHNYGPLNAIIPILSATSIIIFRKNRYVLCMALTLLIGIFLTKGVNEPGGYLYYLAASNLPYGVGAILRNPTKFVSLVVFCYAFLISLLLVEISRKMKQCELPTRCRSTFFRSIVLGTLLLLILSSITYGTFLDLESYTWPRYKPIYIPQVYDEINNQFLQQSESIKCMWIPSGGSYGWKPYIITAFPDIASSKPFVYFGKIYPEPLKSTESIGNTLAILGVKYVIYHGDSLDYPNEEILQDLLKQKDLKVVYSLNYTYLPEDNSNLPLPINQTDPQHLQPTFQLIQPNELPRGKEANLTLYYQIPQHIVEQGFKGLFWAGFNIAINAFPAGNTDVSRRIFINDDYILHLTNQTLINETQGYATYRVKVPYNYLGTAIDIYANFYDGSFTSLTPSYFIARLSVTPPEITAPFIVFENEDYKGQVYGNNTVLFQIDAQRISPVEWNVKVNASEPFLLTFTEPYDKLWRAYVNGKEVQPFPIMDLVNGFQINDTGTLNIRLYYTLQGYYNIGWTISLTALITCTTYLAYSYTKPKHLLKKLKHLFSFK